MIDLSESEVKSGAPVERPVTVGDQQGGVTTSLLSPLSSLLSCLPRLQCLEHSTGSREAAAETDHDHLHSTHWSLWVICCLQKYFRRDGNSCNNTALISLLEPHSSIPLTPPDPVLDTASWPRYCVSVLSLNRIRARLEQQSDQLPRSAVHMISSSTIRPQITGAFLFHEYSGIV